MERFRQRYGIALTKKKLQEIILMLMAWEADLAMYARKQEYYREKSRHPAGPSPAGARCIDQQGRVMQIESQEKSWGPGPAAAGRGRHAVLWRLPGGSGNGAEQSNQIMSGVCGHWVKSFQAFHRPCPASGAGFRRERRC